MSDRPSSNTSPTSNLAVTPRRVFALILAVLAVVFIAQNPQDVTIQFLTVELTAPLWLAALVLVVIGVAIGALLAFRRPTKGGRSR